MVLYQSFPCMFFFPFYLLIYNPLQQTAVCFAVGVFCINLCVFIMDDIWLRRPDEKRHSCHGATFLFINLHHPEVKLMNATNALLIDYYISVSQQFTL